MSVTAASAPRMIAVPEDELDTLVTAARLAATTMELTAAFLEAQAKGKAPFWIRNWRTSNCFLDARRLRSALVVWDAANGHSGVYVDGSGGDPTGVAERGKGGMSDEAAGTQDGAGLPGHPLLGAGVGALPESPGAADVGGLVGGDVRDVQTETSRLGGLSWAHAGEDD